MDADPLHRRAEGAQGRRDGAYGGDRPPGSVFGCGGQDNQSKSFCGRGRSDEVELWDTRVNVPTLVGSVQVHDGAVLALSYSQGVVYGASADGTVRAVDVERRVGVGSYVGHMGSVHGVMVHEGILFSVSHDRFFTIGKSDSSERSSFGTRGTTRPLRRWTRSRGGATVWPFFKTCL